MSEKIYDTEYAKQMMKQEWEALSHALDKGYCADVLTAIKQRLDSQFAYYCTGISRAK